MHHDLYRSLGTLFSGKLSSLDLSEKLLKDAIMDHKALSAAFDSALGIKKSIPEAQAAHSLVAKTNELAAFTAQDSEGVSAH